MTQKTYKKAERPSERLAVIECLPGHCSTKQPIHSSHALPSDATKVSVHRFHLMSGTGGLAQQLRLGVEKIKKPWQKYSKTLIILKCLSEGISCETTLAAVP